MANKRVKVRVRIKKSAAKPPCWHNRVASDGFCLDCGKRAAIMLEELKTMTAGNPHPFADISSL